MTTSASKMKPYLFYISPEIHVALKVLKAQTGAPEGESIRRALAQYLKGKGALKPARPAGRRKKR